MKSERILRMTPSATIELEGTVADLHAQGIDVIGLNAGEPDFNTPANIIMACTRAMEEGKTKYCKVSGIPELRQAICDKLLQDNGVAYHPDQISVSTGAKQALFNAVLAVVNPGDEVIIPKPCWVSYVEIVKLAEGVPVLVDTVPGTFALDMRAIEQAITPKTRAVMINTPNNPTGAVYSEESLRKLGELAVAHDFYIISDEVYEKLIYGKSRHVCAASLSPEIYEHTIVVNGFSKAYAMTGWRLGYAASPRDVARSIASVQGHTTSNSTTFVQWAGVEALRGPQDSIARMKEQFDKRRCYLVEALNRIPGIRCANAEGAFYLMPDVSSYYEKKTPDGKLIADSFGFCNYLLEAAHVAIVPGAAFECPNAVRFAYSNSLEKIQAAVARIEKALAALK
ncbi:pyridoxal phosphate-dependent aminotransferase [Yanshouia hominis]|uniref:Aminotransferase n=1 Tax=Yanshouia hominis TaxID=2763673 RepID=A0ABR7NHZ4_9FIRM|nr:pyridoxal phosphate-dependent aminotransferase [Yanshouia hominis]MBC8575457.1 pyridoxal phosphate-dependent aminotransferase [Yanshouia hominis]